MKKAVSVFCLSLLFVCTAIVSFVYGRQSLPGYILEHESDIARQRTGMHGGLGMTTGYAFFEKTPGLKLNFKKRILPPGASIGYHLQSIDEIYYVLSGTGTMQMNGETFPVKQGDAVLTRPGNSHGLLQTGKEDLVIFINYGVD